MWRLFCYDNRKGVNLWQEWYDRVSDEVKAKHDAKWEFLEVSPATEWQYPHTKAFKGFVEVRLGGGVAWRVFGFFGLQQGEFTVVLIGNHKGNQYDPRDALKTAGKRKKEIESDPGRRISCVRPK
jgi:hypothetical protein